MVAYSNDVGFVPDVEPGEKADDEPYEGIRRQLR